MANAPRSLQFAFDAEPHAKGRPRFDSATGRVYTPANTRAFETYIRDMAHYEMLKARQRKLWDLDTPCQHLKAKIFVSRDNQDLTNVLKALEDGLQGVVWRNDKQVRAITASIHRARRGARSDVTVECLEDSFFEDGDT